MLKNILPSEIYKALTLKCLEQEINEIRLRLNKPITVICNTKTYFLGEAGIGVGINQAIYASLDLINDIVFKACDYSIYSVNEQLKQGFLVVDGGLRLGLCGEVVKDDKIKTIKNFTSLCIRVPHIIKNASLPIFHHVLSDGVINNTLIISPPGAGKTTMLRDLVYQFSNHNYPYNVFIADERGEITMGNKNACLGNFYDSICYLNKNDSFLMGIRSMSPDIIVTDELGSKEDCEAIEYAINCGASIIATVHARNIDELKSKKEISDILKKGYFKRIIVLSKENGVGTIEGVYKENLTRIYGGVV